MAKEKEKGVTRHPLVVAVIAPLLIAAILAIAHYAGLTAEVAVKWLTTVCLYFENAVALPRWGVWAWIAYSAVLTAAFILQTYFNLRPEYAAPEQAYQSDVIFGLRWRWKVTARGDVWGENIFCTECDHQLFPSDYEYVYGASRLRVTCPNCNHAVDTEDPTVLSRRAKLEIERRMRTGEWKKAIHASK